MIKQPIITREERDAARRTGEVNEIVRKHKREYEQAMAILRTCNDDDFVILEGCDTSWQMVCAVEIFDHQHEPFELAMVLRSENCQDESHGEISPGEENPDCNGSCRFPFTLRDLGRLDFMHTSEGPCPVIETTKGKALIRRFWYKAFLPMSLLEKLEIVKPLVNEALAGTDYEKKLKGMVNAFGLTAEQHREMCATLSVPKYQTPPSYAVETRLANIRNVNTRLTEQVIMTSSYPDKIFRTGILPSESVLACHQRAAKCHAKAHGMQGEIKHTHAMAQNRYIHLIG